MSRIAARFAQLKAEGRGALMPFLEAWDPDAATSMALLRGMPGAGADLIEIGCPFTDPMADGPTVQMASRRALDAGATMAHTLAMVREFRREDDTTPIVLMGYLNQILSYGVERFCKDASVCGADGLIVVDLPTEEADLLLPAARAHGLDVIRLVAPTTDDTRLPAVLANPSGFVYYVSITGIPGAAAPKPAEVGAAVARIKRHTHLPVAVGFGVRDAESAAAIAVNADAVVVGSALIDALRGSLDGGRATSRTVSAVAALTESLAKGVRGVAKP